MLERETLRLSFATESEIGDFDLAWIFPSLKDFLAWSSLLWLYRLLGVTLDVILFSLPPHGMSCIRWYDFSAKMDSFFPRGIWGLKGCTSWSTWFLSYSCLSLSSSASRYKRSAIYIGPEVGHQPRRALLVFEMAGLSFISLESWIFCFWISSSRYCSNLIKCS